MRLNLHLLRLFVAVAESGSFSRAAEALWISQPAVSKGIRELEHQLDLVLIERGVGGGRNAATKGLRLTEAGTSLLAHARGIFAMERAAMEDVRARVGVQRGSLVIGASTTVASYWLPEAIATFCKQYPEIVPRVLVGNTEWVCAQLLECRIDLALVEGRVDDAHIDRIDVLPWRDEPLTIVAAPSLAKDAQTPTQARWIMREPGSGTRQATEALCAANGITATPWMEMASNEAIARTVAHGAGIAMLPRAVVADLLALGALVEVPLPAKMARVPLQRPLYQLLLKGRPQSPATQRMVALLG
jgi:DNA-binding transcriptional LysR family regulator